MGRNRGPAAVELTLSGDERGQLIRWARRRKSAQALALRCRIVLECSTGASNAEVARGVGMSVPTVRKWRDRFVEHRLDGLVDIPRPPVIGMEQVERVIIDTLESTPQGGHALVAGQDGLRPGTVGLHDRQDLEGFRSPAAP